MSTHEDGCWTAGGLAMKYQQACINNVQQRCKVRDMQQRRVADELDRTTFFMGMMQTASMRLPCSVERFPVVPSRCSPAGMLPYEDL